MAPDNLHIQLKAGKGKALQAGEVGIAAAVIVEGEAEAPIAKLVHLFCEHGKINHAGLGDFQMDKGGRNPVSAQDVDETRAQFLVHALDRREVDIDPLQLASAILAEEAADLFQHLLAETDDLAVFLGETDKVVGGDQIALLIPEPRQRLGADDGTGLRVHDGLEKGLDAVCLDGMVQGTLHGDFMLQPGGEVQIQNSVLGDVALAESMDRDSETLHHMVGVQPDDGGGAHLEKSGVQVQLGLIGNPGLMKAVCNLLRQLSHVHLLGTDQSKAAGVQIKEGERGIGLLDIRADQPDALFHLPDAVNLAGVGIVAQDKAEDTKVLFLDALGKIFPQCREAEAAVGRGIDGRIFKGNEDDQQRHQIEDVQHQILRHQHADEIAAQKNDVVADQGDQIAPGKLLPVEEDEEEGEQQIKTEAEVNDIVERTAVIAVLIDQEDRPGPEAGERDQLREEKDRGIEKHRRAFHIGKTPKKVEGVVKVQKNADEKQDKIGHVQHGRESDGQILVIHVRSAGEDVKEKNKELCQHEQEEQPVFPHRQSRLAQEKVQKDQQDQNAGEGEIKVKHEKRPPVGK